MTDQLKKSLQKVSLYELEGSERKLLLDKYENENKKLEELNRLLKIQIKNIEGKALNFSSKLIMVEVQLGLERDKNHKLLQTIAELKPGQLQDKELEHSDSSTTPDASSTTPPPEELVEKFKEIKSKEQELLKAKE